MNSASIIFILKRNHRHLKNQGFYWLLFVVILCSSVPAKHERELRWQRAERMVGKEYYSRSVIDSLKTEFGIGPNRDLRTLDNLVMPFNKKEKMVYDGGWAFVSAGFGIMNASVDREKKILLVDAKAITNNFTSAFYEVRDYVRSTIDLQGFYPLLFEQHIRENRYERDSWTLFDHANGKVYSNRTKKQTEYEIKPFVHDYMSLLYYIRTLSMAPGDTFSVNCFVHGKDFPIFFEVIGQEEVTVAAGVFQCIKVQPRLVGEGRRFNKRDKMYLWFTNDRYHVLVQGRSKVAMGWLSAELLYYERE
jgi:hypothetical protein